MFHISAKYKRLVVIYSVAAVLVLGGLAALCSHRLERYRMAADYASARAFDETVTAVEQLSRSLKKLQYVSDEELGRSLCSGAYAQAMSAEASLSVLPFSTQELEKLSGFLNKCGDYAASLIAQEGELVSDEQKPNLEAMAEAAAEFFERLSHMQSDVNNGSLLMDSLENREDGNFLSEELLGYEDEFESPEDFVYDGKYSPREQSPPGELTEQQAKELAAKAAGVEPRQLKDEYSYEGTEGRRCYSSGSLLLCVSSRGLESMSQSRLVSGGGISAAEARNTAESFLETLGYTELALCSENMGESMAVYHYAKSQDGAIFIDDYISISVAMDDGSVYSFDAGRYRDGELSMQWNTDEEAAKKALPEGTELDTLRKVVIRSPGGGALPCWELECSAPDGEKLRVYVDAEQGKQRKIELLS